MILRMLSSNKALILILVMEDINRLKLLLVEKKKTLTATGEWDAFGKPCSYRAGRVCSHGYP